MIDIFLPIAGVEINVIFLLFSGLLVGFMSGLFGVGGGFLMTPILIFMGIPPATAVGTEANHILGSSVSGAIAHGRKKYRLRNRFISFNWRNLWIHFGSGIFKFLRESGNIDLIISLMYIIFLAVIGTLMLIESSLSIIRKGNVRLSNKRKRNISHYLPLKYKFKQSKIYVSILVPVVIGAFVGILSALMGVGGGFVMVPAMIYLLGMNTVYAIGTSLFQIVFVTTNVVILQATYNQSVDILLAIFLLIGGVIGAQIGSRYSSRLKGEHLRILLAIAVIGVCLKMFVDLVQEPMNNSRIIIQETNL